MKIILSNDCQTLPFVADDASSMSAMQIEKRPVTAGAVSAETAGAMAEGAAGGRRGWRQRLKWRWRRRLRRRRLNRRRQRQRRWMHLRSCASGGQRRSPEARAPSWSTPWQGGY